MKPPFEALLLVLAAAYDSTSSMNDHKELDELLDAIRAVNMWLELERYYKLGDI